MEKCEAIPLSPQPDGVLVGVKVVQLEDAALLGGALGNRAMNRLLVQHAERLTTMQNRLLQLGAHDAFFLLRHSITAHKLLYNLRTSPCYQLPVHLHNIDDILRNMLQSVLNVQLGDQQRAQATLPARCGGIGIPATSDLAAAAFLASQTATAALASRIAGADASTPAVFEATTQWRAASGCDDIPTSVRQSMWTKPIFQRRYDDLLNMATEMDRARLQ